MEAAFLAFLALTLMMMSFNCSFRNKTDLFEFNSIFGRKFFHCSDGSCDRLGQQKRRGEFRFERLKLLLDVAKGADES